MFVSICQLSNFLKNSCSEAVAHCIVDAVQYYLLNADDIDYPGGDIDKLALLAFLLEFNDPYIKRQYDPCLNFKVTFDFSDLTSTDENKSNV